MSSPAAGCRLQSALAKAWGTNAARLGLASAHPTTARTYHDAVYVIAVNAGTKAAQLRLTVPGLGNRTLLVLGATKTLAARGDVITDRLAPLAVRIYVAPPPP